MFTYSAASLIFFFNTLQNSTKWKNNLHKIRKHDKLLHVSTFLLHQTAHQNTTKKRKKKKHTKKTLSHTVTVRQSHSHCHTHHAHNHSCTHMSGGKHTIVLSYFFFNFFGIAPQVNTSVSEPDDDDGGGVGGADGGGSEVADDCLLCSGTS